MREWWQDEADNPPIPGRWVIFYDPTLIDARILRQGALVPGSFVPVHTPTGNLADAFTWAPVTLP
jgi:hypothetical protein